MMSIRALLCAGVASLFATGHLAAADYYVSPIKPGPVAGTPLAAITLQATEAESRLQLNVNQRGNTAGKWVKVGEEQPVAATTADASSEIVVGGTSQATTDTTAGSTTTGTTTTGTTTTTAPAPMAAAASAPMAAAAPAASNTYPSVSALINSGVLTGGDRVFLLDGYHGMLDLNGLKFTSAVTFAQAPGQTAHVDTIRVQNSTNLVVRDLKVWPSAPIAASSYIVRTMQSTSNIVFTNLDIRSRPDAGGYALWPATTWTGSKYSAMLVQGANSMVVGNRVTGTYHGIFISGDNSRIEGNIIDGFAGDGMRALGDNSVVRRNRLQNCVKIDGNHGDGFQSYSIGTNGVPGAGTVYGLVIEENKILEWVAPVTNPLRCKLQGVGMFDGMFVDTVIRNNLIVVSQYHGITVQGADKLLIANNTVTRPDGAALKYPWIRVGPHGKGTPSSNVLAANNTANFFIFKMSPTLNALTSNNIVVTNAATEFVAPTKQDFTLQPNAKSVNAGTAAAAPPTDITGTARPKGGAPDAGAYESF